MGGSHSRPPRRPSSVLLDKGFAALERDYAMPWRPLEPPAVAEEAEVASPEQSPHGHSDGMDLTLLWMDGSSFLLRAPCYASCEELIAMLHRRGVVPYGCPALLWGDQLLEGSAILQDLGIQHGCELQVVLTRPSLCLTVDATCRKPSMSP